MPTERADWFSGGFAAAHSGKPPAFRQDTLLSPRLRLRASKIYFIDFPLTIPSRHAHNFPRLAMLLLDLCEYFGLSDGKPEAYRYVLRPSRQLPTRHSSNQLRKPRVVAHRTQIRIILKERFVFVSQSHRTLQPFERLVGLALQRIDRRHRIS